ncbi:dTMP kinase [Saccharothrix variisporea]|uniref:dTMP kinase n=1 Tax=Saccharothrix variisporea TaxID=543527 RepID=UPI001476D332|nr:dTMP kinase [Saccharothrix variisporea]
MDDRHNADMSSGRFIVFEGIDGSGKTTQAQILANRIREAGRIVHVTSEPTNSPIGNLIRQGMTGRIQLDDRVIAALFAADRIDHLTNHTDGILDLLASGCTVISDRYYFSSYAYHTDYTGQAWVKHANAIAEGLLRADLTIYLDISPDIAVERLSKGRSFQERYERLDRLVSVRNSYEQAFRDADDTENIVIVDGHGDVESTSKSVWAVVEQHLTAF